jgi:Kef-type K+ transport system membrane component KefB
MVDTLLLFFVVLLVTFVFGEVFFRFQLPRIVGQIIAGLFFGLFFTGFFSAEVNSIIALFSEIGIIFLLILTGLEIDLKKIKGNSKDVLVMAFSSVLIPFVLGFGFALLIGESLIVAFVLGACLSLTAEATNTIVLMQKNVLKSRLGEIMIAAGTADDLFELLFLAVLLVLVESSSAQGIAMLPVEIFGFFIAVFIALKLLPRVMKLFKQESTDNYFTLAVIIGLGIAILSSVLSLGPIIGALIAGLLLQKAIKSEKIEHAIEKHLKAVTFALVIPFFYLHIGLNFNLQSFGLHPFMFALILLIAFTGKMLGALIVKPFSALKLEQLTLIGWAMNSRGLTELVIVEIARQKIPGFPIELYTAIVFMTLITTLAFPIVLEYYLKKNPAIME